MSSETHTAAYTHTQMHAIAVRDKPRLLPRFPVACPGPGPPPPSTPPPLHVACLYSCCQWRSGAGVSPPSL